MRSSAAMAAFLALALAAAPSAAQPRRGERQRKVGIAAMVVGAIEMALGVALQYAIRGRAETQSGAILAHDLEAATFGVGAITLVGGSILVVASMPAPAPAPVAAPARSSAGLTLRGWF